MRKMNIGRTGSSRKALGGLQYIPVRGHRTTEILFQRIVSFFKEKGLDLDQNNGKRQCFDNSREGEFRRQWTPL